MTAVARDDRGAIFHQGGTDPVRLGRGGQGTLWIMVVLPTVPFKKIGAPPVPVAKSVLVNHDILVELATSLLSRRALDQGRKKELLRK